MSAPVFLIHGLGSSHEHGWRRHGWVDLLEDEGRLVIDYDLPGHGSRAASSSADEYVDIAAQLLKACEHGEPLDLIGFSAGARIALRMACLDPSRVRRLVLIGAGDSFLTPFNPEPLIAAIAAEHPDSDHRLGTFHRLARSGANSVEGLTAFLRRPDPPFSQEMLANMVIPTLVITGARDHMGDAARLRAALCHATHFVVPECNHFALPSDRRAIEAALAFISA